MKKVFLLVLSVLSGLAMAYGQTNEFGYPVMPNTSSSETGQVGSMGVAFNVSATGGATFSIPIEVPLGVGGLQPSLSIVYNSQSGNGIAGWGCNISGISAITRAPKDIYHDGTARALTYLADDAYYLDGQRLIYSSGTIGQEGAVYYPESDPFTKVTVHGTYNTTTANTWFEVLASNGMKYYYGNTASGRLTYSSGNSPRIQSWYIDRAEDPMGNFMTYSYYKRDYFMCPSTITYGNNKNSSTGLSNTVIFGYTTRNDATPFVLEGVKGQMNTLLSSITTKTGNNAYRTYQMNYNTTGDGTATKFSRLINVTVKNAAGDAMKPTVLNWTYLPSFTQNMSLPTVNKVSSYPSVSFEEQQFTSGDFNGDGLTDIVGIAPVKIQTGYNSYSYDTYACVYYASLNSSGNTQFTTGTYYSLGPNFKMGDWTEMKGNPMAVDFDGDGINDLIIPNTSIIKEINYKIVEFLFKGGTFHNKSVKYQLKQSSEMPLYASGDFNKDGKGDLVMLERGHNKNKYPGEIVGLNSGTALYRGAFELTLPSKPEKLFVSDFNADGLDDIIVFYDKGYTIFWNQGTGISASTFTDSKKTTGTNIIGRRWTKMSPGDFNGDGLMDFIYNDGDSNWYFALNNGNGTFSKVLACTLTIHDQDFTSKDDDKFDVTVYDFDGDGKSDVIITKAMYTKKKDLFSTWGEFNKTYTYWMRSTGSTLTQVASATSNKDTDALSHRYLIGDFNGDGQLDLMNYGYNCYASSNANASPTWRLYKNNGFVANSSKVISITDGYGATTGITYASFINGGIYTKGTGSKYPMADYLLPLHAVKTVTMGNGACTTLVKNYQYSGLKVHLQGKGILGLTYQKVTDTSLGTVTESEVKSWNTSFFIPALTSSKTTVSGKTVETNVTLTVADKGLKKYFAYPSTKTEKDLYGNTVTTTCRFNTTYGYQEEERTDFGNNMYKTVQYGSYILAGGGYKPQLITTLQKHSDDGAAFTQKTSIAYHAAKGYRTKVVQNQGAALQLTTDYTYDNIGNLLTSRQSGSGITPVTIYNTYDATYRFLTKTYTSPATSVKSYTYNTWGNVLTEKDETLTSNILTTTYNYNNWGILASTVLPNGQRTTYIRGWGTSSAMRYFVLTQGTAQPWVKTWYDNKGREVQVETIGAKNISIKTTTNYNKNGLATKKQVQAGNLTTTEEYGYDDLGRLTSSSNSAGQKATYTYDNRKITTVTNGRTYTKTFDAWGNIKSSTDPASSISYTYYSLGKPKNIVTGGATVSMTYDAVGNQTGLTDPNAGTITYAYDAAGRLTRQVDGGGKTTMNTYDALGRLISTSINGASTTYTYGTTGYDLQRLTKVQTGSNYTAYTYDKYGRTLTEKQQVEGSGSTLNFTYAYDAKGLPSSTTYPSGLQVNRQYDAYGNLQKVLAGTQAIWELTGVTGTVITSLQGGTLTSTRTVNTKGLLSNQKTVKGSSVLYEMMYAFDGATGNLSGRSGMMNPPESFRYDNLDRLTAVVQGNGFSMEISYKANGNINSKTGVGTYGYGTTSRPHAVTSVNNPGGLVPNQNQTITYTAFNKAASISEKTGNDNFLLNITYGPDQQRWKTELKKNNVSQKTIIFAGDYETVTENGVTKQMHYISGGSGLAAVYVKQAGQTDKIYYACTDHLGSIIKLVDGNGTEVFKAAYDAWGNRTITNNTFAFHRGYTGHEHLAEFRLINMNGRMYDPALGRFLSPDPYVQMPDFSQNFNRYTYCLNNPLIYTDPSGEYIGIDDLIAAAIGGVVNLAVNAWQGNLGGHGFWGGVGRGFAAFGAGAVGGWGALYPEFGGWIWGGATVGATNAWLSGAKGWDIAVGAGVGTVSGVVGGAVGQWGGQYLGGIIINGTKITSPLLQGAVTGTIGGAAGGYAGGFTAGMIMTGDLREANSAGLKNVVFGAPIGGISGSVSAYRYAVKNDINPWNGNFNKSIVIGEGMDRVTAVAKDLNAETITNDWNSNNIGDAYIGKNMPTSEGLDFNAQWIQNKIDNGYHIYDIGPRGTSVSSPYYNLEIGRTLSYPYLHPTNTYNMPGIRIIRFK